MIIPHGATDRKVAFVAVDITDLKTRETSTGITGGSWDVWYSLNGGTLTQDATPTVTELSSSNAPGVWVYDVDVAAQTTLPTGVTTAELTLHIAYEIASTPSIMAPVTRTVTVSAGENAITCGTAASAGASTLSLASGETFADDELIGCVAEIVSGTGRGQVRVITDYAATGDQATIAPNWTVTPSGTILYVIRSGSVKATTLGTDAVNSDSIADANEFEPASDPVNYLTTGTAFAGGLSTITLVSPAVATANYYRHNLIHLISGTGAGQSRVITDYTAGRVATVDTNWTTNPSTDTVYAVLAQRVPPPQRDRDRRGVVDDRPGDDRERDERLLQLRPHPDRRRHRGRADTGGARLCWRHDAAGDGVAQLGHHARHDERVRDPRCRYAACDRERLRAGGHARDRWRSERPV
jgi:hypothetical protein